MSTQNGTPSEDPQKRQAILEQSILTFAELGFRGTEVQLIADRAGVGKGTVYRYFRSKEDLFWAATYETILRLDRCLFDAMDVVEGASAKFRASAIAYAQFFESNPHCLELAIQDRAEFRGSAPESHREHHRATIQKFSEIFQQGIEAGEFRTVDAQKTTLALGSLLYGIMVLGCHLQSAAPVPLAEHAVDIFLQGLRAESTCSSGRERT
jgi:AcrR family transcriptional regulator